MYNSKLVIVYLLELINFTKSFSQMPVDCFIVLAKQQVRGCGKQLDYELGPTIANVIM